MYHILSPYPDHQTDPEFTYLKAEVRITRAPPLGIRGLIEEKKNYHSIVYLVLEIHKYNR